MGNIPAGQEAGLFAGAELHAVTGKLLPAPERTNLRQAWTQMLLAMVQ